MASTKESFEKIGIFVLLCACVLGLGGIFELFYLRFFQFAIPLIAVYVLAFPQIKHLVNKLLGNE